MRNIFIPSGEITFIGSKERLQRTVNRSAGKLLPERQFQMVLTVKVHQHVGYTFRIYGTHAPYEENIKISYRILPTTVTLLRYLLPFALLFVYLVLSLLHASPALQPLLALAVMALTVFGYCHNSKRCEETFHTLFREATSSRKNR